MSEGSPTERFGPYIVYEQLGIGGMAQVHRAVAANSDVQHPVALKRMLSHIAGSEDMVKSFVREARLASYLRHQNVAQTYDLGRVGDTYFIVMELITGRNLREVLRHCGATTGPMPVPFALNILNQICDALDYAHNLCDETGTPLGIIHRDVSPSNVIVSTTGVVKLIDFGIAKASAAGMQTMSGTLKGKFAYMAPEYLAGQIDPRADLFAVGVIAHELLTNKPLFSGRDDIDTLTRVRDMPIAPPSKKNPLVPPEIDDIVMTALARDPERRWQHATALRSALTTLTRRLGLVASNPQVVQWLDWAFTQKRRARPGHEPDTETDAEPLDDEPSISIQQPTVDLSAKSQQITLRMNDDAPQPPPKAPVGTPLYVPAQHPVPAGLAASADRSSPMAAPRPVMPPIARASASIPTPARAPSGTAPPARRPPSAVQPAVRPATSSQPPPIAAQPAPRPASPSQPPPIAAQPVPRPAAPSPPRPIAAHGIRPSRTLPLAGPPPPRPASPSQPPFAAPPAPVGPPVAMPAMPAHNAAPLGAPRPSLPTHEPAASPQLQRDFDERASRQPIPPPDARLDRVPGHNSGRTRRYSRVAAVILVVLAAAVAAAAVYFVLSQLT
ncbi:MAG TPA: protein kinase [Kofleriaceae bacterium]|nr:protein kinase [Kofleriaceae bacterium]